MNREIVNYIACPKCRMKGWSFDGYGTDSRYVDGFLKCTSGHKYKISQDILRFDTESSEEEMQFLDHELTGYPKEIKEMERLEFLSSIEKSLESIEFTDKPLLIIGNLILFFRFTPTFANLFSVVDENEGLLRQIQNLSVQKQIFPKSGFIRTNEFLSDEMQVISFLSTIKESKLNKGDIVFSFSQDFENKHKIWQSETHVLTMKVI